MSRLGYEKPSVPKPFATGVDAALRELVASETSVAVLGRFLAAYENRRKFSWLPESGQNPEAGMKDGLVSAFRYALASYIPGRSQHPEYSTESFPISREARKRIEEAVSVVSDDAMSLMQFATGLSTDGHDPGKIQHHEIKRHIVLALEDYYLLRETAVSPDPW
ncbi:hypothetical protein [Streptomyces sp. BF23-19]|uniref:hypothetical protein n=1 Tax=unclassified Streptomyces TaxID=2593676 RepID=UPI0034E4315E